MFRKACVELTFIYILCPLHPISDINNVNMVHYYVIVQLNNDMQDTYVDMQHSLSGMFT